MGRESEKPVYVIDLRGFVVKINCLYKIKEERKRSNTQIKNTRIYVVWQYVYIHRRR